MSMNDYQSKAPRFVIGMAAIAVTAATIGLSVIVPARMDFRSQEVPMLAQADDTPQAMTQGAGNAPLVESIDVYGVREPKLVTVVESRRVQLKNRIAG
jgi:hypothetical protein